MKKNKPNGVNKYLLSQMKEEINPHEYLGPDGSNITDAHKEYLQRCQEFRAKAKRYFDDNTRLRKSVTHKNVQGYETFEDSNRKIFEERSENWDFYLKRYNQIVCSDAMYDNFEAKSKRIRVIRESPKDRLIAISENADKERHTWFTRHQTLSKFIQAARFIIIRNRLEKRLTKLKNISLERFEESLATINSEDKICNSSANK